MSSNTSDQQNALLSAIINSTQDVILSINLNGIITSWNKGAEIVFGYSISEAIGNHISMIIPAEKLEEEEKVLADLVSGKKISIYDTTRKTKSGKIIYISLSVSPILDETGIIGVVKIVRDTTRQKEAEAEIKKYSEQLELINNISKNIGVDLDEQHILQKVTDTTTKIAGAAFGAFFYNKIDAKGEALMLYTLAGAPREAFDKFGMPRNTEVFRTTFDGLGTLRSDDITKDPRYGKNRPNHGMPKGHLPVASYLAVPVISQAGIVIGGLFYGHPEPAKFKAEHENIIEAIAVQAAIALDNAKMYEEIKLLNNKKDEFIGYASHELKTPLTTLSGYLQMAENNPDVIMATMPKIKKQISKLNAIISDLLDISKIEANKLNLNFIKINLWAFIKEVVESLNQFSTTHTIQYSLPAEDEVIVIDVQKMGQVVTNLLTNAIKYSPQSDKVKLTAIRLGDQVHISIQDWGIGISVEEKGNIFNRFYRIPSSKDKVDGLGVGLYIAQEIMEAHHGKIWVDSELDKGSVFHISFPIGDYRLIKSL